jgi:hypothetical protein
MPGLLKKWIKHGVARIAVAIAYLFITFTIPLTHTCNLHKAHPQACCSNSTFHCCSFETAVCTHSEFNLKQSSYNIESGCHNSLCLACVYSMNCRSTEISPATTPIIIAIPAFIQSLPYSRFAKRLKWTCSTISRAPPVSIS